jgi:hypothetical protein
MAQLERSEENRLRANLKLAKTGDDKIAVGKRLTNYTDRKNKKGGTPGERSAASTVDWVPDSD